MDTVLYFPLSSPPRHVAAYAALYWDRILTLAPAGYRPANPDATALYDARILRFIEPDAYGDHVGEIATDVAGIIACRPQWLQENAALTAENRLYPAKLPIAVQDRLVEAGVAVPTSGSAFMVDPGVLSSVVSVTARVVADSEMVAGRRRVTLFADRKFNYDLAIGATDPDPMGSWRIDLGELLPCPAPNVPMEKLLELRRRYNDERIRLMAAIDRFAAALTTAHDDPTAAEIWLQLQAAGVDFKRAGHGLGVDLTVRGLVFGVAAAATLVSLEAVSHPLAALMSAGAAVATNVTATGIRRRQPGDTAFLARAERL